MLANMCEATGRERDGISVKSICLRNKLILIPQCSPNDEQEVKSEIEEGSNSENGSQVGQFKNVVAIVDPPRAGLYPTVRILLCNSTTYMVRSY